MKTPIAQLMEEERRKSLKEARRLSAMLTDRVKRESGIESIDHEKVDTIGQGEMWLVVVYYNADMYAMPKHFSYFAAQHITTAQELIDEMGV